MFQDPEIISKLTTDLLCEVNFEGFFVKVHPLWKKKLGYTCKELKSKPLIDFFHPDDHRTLSKEITKLMDGERHTQFEGRFLHKDGSYRWLKWNALSDLNEMLIFAMARDVSIEKKSEKRYQDAEKIFGILQDLNTDGWWEWNLETNEQYLSPRSKELLGYKPNEIHSEPESWKSLVHPDDLSVLMNSLQEHTEEGSPFEPVIRFVHKNGSVVWVMCRGVGLEDENGKYARLVGTHVDITTLMRAERKFRRLLEYAPDATAIVNRQGDIILANAMAEQVFGYSRDELIGQKIELLITEKFRSKHREYRKNFIASPSIKKMRERKNLYARRKDGSEFPVSIALSPLETEEDMLICATLREVVPIKLHEEELFSLMENLIRDPVGLDRYVERISEDIQSSLSFVSTFSQALGKKYKGHLDAKGMELLNLAEESTEQMRNVMNDLFRHFKISPQELAPRPSEVK